ncbi:MAG TPA: Ku protein [Acidimicrobiia bacterium]|nr:Ku protein [Acidimicrobiia bacterium]
MPSAIWTGTISFGLVTVPVKLTSATKSRDVRFNQLEEGTGARIRYRRISEQSGDEVPNERIVKGYEMSPGQYVVVTDEEMKALAPKASRTIEIEDFVDLDEIDPVFFEQPYYLAPDANAVRPYKLLVEAMTELRKVAIGRLVMRSKESLVAIRPVDGVLCLETMRYADEVLPAGNVLPDTDEVAEPTERELEMARQLVGALTTEFEPDKYHDQYREELLALIERKAAGEEVVAEPVVEEKGTVLDLMAALEASLARAGTAGEAAEAAGAGGGRPRAVKAVKPTKAAKAAKAPAKAAAKKSTAKKAAAKAAPAKSTRSRRSA